LNAAAGLILECFFEAGNGKMKRYVIGVDGGGTKTDCLLFDLDGRMIDHLRWGTTSHEFLSGGYEACEREVLAMLGALFQKNGVLPCYIKTAVFGMAGVDTVYQEKIVSGIVEKSGIPDFLVCNDGYLGIKAGTTNGVGITVINGTGCSFEGIGASGKMMQIGGQSVIMDDVAGGYIIGRNIIRLVHRELFLNGEKTILTEMLMKEMGVSGGIELMDELVRRVGEKTAEIKHFSHFAFEAAAQGDAVAIGYLKEIGREIAGYCKSLIRNLRLYEENTVEIVLIGSGFIRAEDDTHISVMKEEITREYPAAVIKPLTVRPACGAAFWAFARCGLLDPELKEKIIKQIV
jgi:N-acetylglucosamine kinase-like BadF-type ATPase